jgi:hypothetical protein
MNAWKSQRLRGERTMKRYLPILTVAVILAFSQLASSQEDMTVIAPEALGTLTRPAATFVHDQHNEKAGVEDCVICHHGGSDGVQDTTSSTEGTACADCHAVQPVKGATGLSKAYHQQCISCHEQNGKGPVACGQCHVR